MAAIDSSDDDQLLVFIMSTSLLVRKNIWDEMPLIISRMPRELGDLPPSEDELGAWITSQLDTIMEEFLIQGSERELWEQRDKVDLPPSLWARLDELIIFQTENLGDLIEHSTVVRGRIQVWKIIPHGEELFHRYNAARDKHMRHLRRRGGALPPIDPGFKQFKVATVSELRVVLPDLRGHFAALRRRVTPDELLTRFRHTVAERHCEHLLANRLSWENFFTAQNRHHTVESLLKQKPASMFDAWAAWATTYKPEVLRQKITRQKL